MSLVDVLFFRYIQVGNAAAVLVARALGYSLGHAIRGIGGADSPAIPIAHPKLPWEY